MFILRVGVRARARARDVRVYQNLAIKYLRGRVECEHMSRSVGFFTGSRTT